MFDSWQQTTTWIGLLLGSVFTAVLTVAGFIYSGGFKRGRISVREEVRRKGEIEAKKDRDALREGFQDLKSVLVVQNEKLFGELRRIESVMEEREKNNAEEHRDMKGDISKIEDKLAKIDRKIDLALERVNGT